MAGEQCCGREYRGRAAAIWREIVVHDDEDDGEVGGHDGAEIGGAQVGRGGIGARVGRVAGMSGLGAGHLDMLPDRPLCEFAHISPVPSPSQPLPRPLCGTYQRPVAISTAGRP